MVVSVTRSDGTPFEDGWMQIWLDAPAAGRFFSTDRPFVEGSALLEMRLPIRQGKVEWQYLFPIRGQYRLVVEAVDVNNHKVRRMFYLTVSENERKWIFLGLFTLGLFLLGFVAGRLFTAFNPVSKGNVALWMAVLFVGVIAGDGACLADSKTEKYDAHLEVTNPRVGMLSRIHWSLVGLREGERPEINLNLRVTHLGKGKLVFALQKLPVGKGFSLNFQFTDGDEYRIEAIAELDGQALIHAEKTVSVSGIEPPPTAAIPAIGFFLAVISVGLWMGRWSRGAAPSDPRIQRKASSSFPPRR